MKVKVKQEVLINGVWYRPGDELPKNYKEPEQIKEAKNASST